MRIASDLDWAMREPARGTIRGRFENEAWHFDRRYVSKRNNRLQDEMPTASLPPERDGADFMAPPVAAALGSLESRLDCAGWRSLADVHADEPASNGSFSFTPGWHSCTRTRTA